MKISICVTTKDRPDYLRRSLENHNKYLPDGGKIFVVDDAIENLGIPKAKNRCLELADSWGADHIFLFDDDIWPIVAGWHKSYIDSPEPHFQYCWPDIRPGEYGDKHYFSVGKRLYEDDKIFSFSHPRGQMLYIDAKKVLPKVGGFDPVYGKGMVEHVDWSWRIHNAGLSTWKNQDVIGSENLFYSIDENQNSEPDFETTISDEMRTTVDERNQEILFLKGDSSEYIEYRQDVKPKDISNENNVVICGVFTGKPDFQIKWGERRNSIADPKHVRNIDVSYARALAYSVMEYEQKLIVLTNAGGDKPIRSKYLSYIPTGCSDDPYKNRFLKALHYLIEHEEIDNAWIVDSGDVTMLNNPFPHMIDGKIYVGCETKNLLGCHWMKQNTPVKYYQDWLSKNRSRTLLNCGLLGGSRVDLIEFLTKMFYIWGYNSHNMALTDMLVFNVVGYEHFKDKIIYGEGLVNNIFKSEEPTEQKTEWWLHK